MAMDKRGQLLRLQAKIKRALDGPWFFPTANAVDGYLGTGPVMIVGQRPSTGGGKRAGGGRPGRVLRTFYDSLERHGFEHAHLTDLVKEPKTVGRLTAEELNKNWPFFQREITIVDPAVIVALGNDVLEHLVQRIDRLVPFWRVTHYAYRYGKGQTIGEQFDQDIQRLAAALKRT